MIGVTNSARTQKYVFQGSCPKQFFPESTSTFSKPRRTSVRSLHVPLPFLLRFWSKSCDSGSSFLATTSPQNEDYLERRTKEDA